MKKIVILMLFLVIVVFSFSSCALLFLPHFHLYEEEWSYDYGQHWKECFCEAKTELGNHCGGIFDENGKAICEVCGIEYEEFVFDNDEDDSDDSDVNNADDDKNEEENYIVLDSPVVSVSSEGLATWDSVEGALYYIYKINYGTATMTSKCQVQLSNGDVFEVLAFTNAEGYARSQYSSPVTYLAKNALPTPVVEVSDNGLVTWNAIKNAICYEYKINNGTAVRTEQLSIQLKDMDRVTVKAIGDGREYLDSGYSNTVQFVIYVKLNSPTVSIDDYGNVTWNNVANSTGFAYRINNGEEMIANSREIKINDGDKIAVKALGNGAKYLDSDYSENLEYIRPTNIVLAEKTKFNDSLSTNGPLTQEGLPSVGKPKVLVIPINLDSRNTATDLLVDINKAFNGTEEDTGWESVRSYYKESSYGNLEFDFDVINQWFTPSESAIYYDFYIDTDTGNDGSALILEEAVSYYDSKIDFSQYDNDKDGIVDGIWLIYNYPVDYFSSVSIYWAFQSWYLGDKKCDNVDFYFYAFAGTDFMYESSTEYPNEDISIDAHTYIHETGHMMGLDDYYDYDLSTGPDGGFYSADMMDANIGDHSSVNKLLLGWIDPIVISGKGDIEIELDSFTTSGDAILISNHKLDSIYDEYFLIEFYTEEGLNANDKPIASQYGEVYGIRIIHVDANICYDKNGNMINNSGESYDTGFLYDNSDTDKLFVDTMCCVQPIDGYANEKILYTATSKDFGKEVFTGYKYHDGTNLNFTLEVVEMDRDTATVKISVK